MTTRFKPIKAETRPWGSFEVLAEGKDFWLKRFSVFYGKRSSKQFHNKRNELWTVIEGKIVLELDGTQLLMKRNDTILIPVRAIHRVKGLSRKPAKFLELAMGHCDEKDIVRLEDDYGRIKVSE